MLHHFLIGLSVHTHYSILFSADMGCGEVDDAFFIKEDIQPDSMNTTNLIYDSHLTNLSFAFHIGDMSYARGFSAVVRRERERERERGLILSVSSVGHLHGSDRAHRHSSAIHGVCGQPREELVQHIVRETSKPSTSYIHLITLYSPLLKSRDVQQFRLWWRVWAPSLPPFPHAQNWL